MARVLTEKDVEPAVRGGAVYAAGGGGWVHHGRMLGRAAVNAGAPELVSVEELDDVAGIARDVEVDRRRVARRRLDQQPQLAQGPDPHPLRRPHQLGPEGPGAELDHMLDRRPPRRPIGEVVDRREAHARPPFR